MNTKRNIILILALWTLSFVSARAEEIEIPKDAPRETWQLVYDDYRSIYWGNELEYKDLTMDVTVVRGENCLYIQGLAKSCPTSWVKIGLPDDNILNNQLLLWSNQPVSADGSTLYINVGHMSKDYGGTTTSAYFYIKSRGINSPLVLTKDYSSDKITYRAGDKRDAYWSAQTPNGSFNEGFTERIDDPAPQEQWVWPEKEVYLNPRLIDTTDIPAGINATEGEADAPVYTLSGIKADRNNLTPGIYVSRGKKIVVK